MATAKGVVGTALIRGDPAVIESIFIQIDVETNAVFTRCKPLEVQVTKGMTGEQAKRRTGEATRKNPKTLTGSVGAEGAM